jgi:predicted RNase H-like HicB family nuclease
MEMDHHLSDAVVRPAVHIVVEQDGAAWGAWVPPVPGVFTTGAAQQDVTTRMEAALSFYFAGEHRERLTDDAREDSDEQLHRLADEATATMTLTDAARLAGVTLAAITNAIDDALAPFGVRVTATPASPARILALLSKRAR